MVKEPKVSAKQQKLINVLASLNKKYGTNTIYTLGQGDNQQIPRWSTNIADLDAILGGGIPYGRVIEIHGKESAGKTTLLYHLLAQHSLSMDIPIEGTFDANRAKMFGNKRGQLFVSRSNNGEEALDVGYQFMCAGGQIVAIDSVPSMITKKEFEETDFEKVGQRARIAELLTRQLPKIVAKAEETNCTWIFVNQLRDTMNAQPFGEQTHTTGGRALKHYCSLRLCVTRVEWIKIPNKTFESNSSKDIIIGAILKIKVVKSKVCNPLGECELPVIFDKGFVSFEEAKAIREEMMQANRKAKKGKAHAYAEVAKDITEEDEEDEEDEEA